MNNEQLEEWLCELHERLCPINQQNQNEKVSFFKLFCYKIIQTNGFYAPSTSTVQEEAQAAEQPSWRAMLQQFGPQTNMLLNYFLCNFDDSRLAEPLLTQLLSLYYKFGLEINKMFYKMVFRRFPVFCDAIGAHFYSRLLKSELKTRQTNLVSKNRPLLNAGLHHAECWTCSSWHSTMRKFLRRDRALPQWQNV